MWILVGLEWQLYPSCLQWGISSWRSQIDCILTSQRLSSTRIKAGVGREFTFKGLCSPDLQEVGRDKVCRRHFPRPVKILDVLPHHSQSEFTNTNSVVDELWPLFSALVTFLSKKPQSSKHPSVQSGSLMKFWDEMLSFEGSLWVMAFLVVNTQEMETSRRGTRTSRCSPSRGSWPWVGWCSGGSKCVPCWEFSS